MHILTGNLFAGFVFFVSTKLSSALLIFLLLCILSSSMKLNPGVLVFSYTVVHIPYAIDSCYIVHYKLWGRILVKNAKSVCVCASGQYKC